MLLRLLFSDCRWEDKEKRPSQTICAGSDFIQEFICHPGCQNIHNPWSETFGRTGRTCPPTKAETCSSCVFILRNKPLNWVWAEFKPLITSIRLKWHQSVWNLSHVPVSPAEMSNSHEKQEVADEEVPLNMMAGSGEQQQNNTSTSTSCYEVIDICGHDSRHCSDRYHRKLAIASIICGISCIGIKALIASVKVFQCVFQLSVKSPNTGLHQELNHTGCTSSDNINPIPILTPYYLIFTFAFYSVFTLIFVLAKNVYRNLY